MVLVSMLAAAGCAPNNPTVAPSPVPTNPSATSAPTEIIATITETATAAASEAVHPTPTAQATARPTQKTEYKYDAPIPLGPKRPTIYKDGNDVPFTYSSVGPLPTNVCYLLHVELVNPNVNPGNRGDDFLDKDNCGDQSVAGKRLSFVLYRSKFRNSPNYGTIMAEAVGAARLEPKQVLRMTWFVRVVQNNGISSDNVHYQVSPLSEPSTVLDFDFEPPS